MAVSGVLGVGEIWAGLVLAYAVPSMPPPMCFPEVHRDRT